MPTIQDVAKQAGVAPMTVSRVVNKSGYVAEAMRARVETAIADLGYVPNTLARSLRSRRTNTLALVVTDVTKPVLHHGRPRRRRCGQRRGLPWSS